MPHIRRQWVRFGKAALAALLVGVVLLLDAMAACPALHELIHKDAGHSDHQCAVTVFAQGKVDFTAVEVQVIVSSAPLETAQRIEFSIYQPAIENLPLGRAPPLPGSVS